MSSSEAEVLRPRNLDEALQLRADHPDAVVLAGGTDLMVYLESGTLRPRKVLDIWNLRELRTLRSITGGQLYGAGLTCTDVIHAPGTHPLVREAALSVGAVQIQNRATLGGNICNASPAGDTLPVWLALKAEFELASVSGVRRVPAAEFWKGYKRTELREHELLVGILVRPFAGHMHFRKVGTRMAQSISKVVFAGRYVPGVDAALAFGAVGPTPLRCPEAERALVAGARPADVAAIVEREIHPIDDVRSSADYRRRVAGNIVRHWLESR